MLTIAYIGNFRDRTPAGEPYTTEAHVAASLELLGHRVLRLQEDGHTPEAVAQLVRDEHADLLLWTRTWNLRGGDEHKLIRELPCPSVAYHLDLYAPIPRGTEVDTRAWWRCRYVFTPDGGSDDFWRKHRVNHVYQPAGVFGPECYLAAPSDEYRGDVAFVGMAAKHYHPEWRVWRGALLEMLERTYGSRFRRWGHPEHTIRGSALNRLYASVKVIVGDSLCLGYRHSHYWSDRVYETIGRGGFIVHPRIAGLEEHFTDGEHLALFDFPPRPDAPLEPALDGVRRLVDYYLEHDDERERIRLAGHEHVKAHHTYEHRLRTMLEYLAAREPQLAARLEAPMAAPDPPPAPSSNWTPADDRTRDGAAAPARRPAMGVSLGGGGGRNACGRWHRRRVVRPR